MTNMLFSELIKEKQKSSNDLKKKYKFWVQNKLIWIIKIIDENILKKMLDWLKNLPSNFVVVSEKDYKNENNIFFIKREELIPDFWFDFIVYDDEWDCKLDLYLKKWIVPIVNTKNHLSALFKEFNPIMNEWNSFLYSEKNEWSIFYALVRCLENMKFPQDKKNLIKNVFEI